MDDSSRKGARDWESLVAVLGPIALVACLLIGLAMGIGAAWTISPKLAWVVPSSADDNSIKALQSQLNGIQQAANSIQILLSALAGFMGIYSLLLSLHTHFSLKQIVDNAKEDSKNAVKQATEDFREFRDRIRAQYPHLTDLNMNLSETLYRTQGVLTAALSKMDGYHSHYWTAFYANLSFLEIQEYLFAESQLLVLELFYPAEEKIPQMYRVLAYFYSSKYKVENIPLDWEKSLVYFQKSAKGIAQGDQARLDLDRGTHYLLRANVMLQGENSSVPDIGMTLDESETFFKRIIAMSADVQLDVRAVAFFNIALVMVRKQESGKIGDYLVRAEKYLETLMELLQERQWENDPLVEKIMRDGKKQFKSDAYYNYACAIWRNRPLQGSRRSGGIIELETAWRPRAESSKESKAMRKLQLSLDLLETKYEKEELRRYMRKDPAFQGINQSSVRKEFESIAQGLHVGEKRRIPKGSVASP